MITESSQLPYLTERFTGVRPTGTLTLANALGAIKPLIEGQSFSGSDDCRPLAFVADLHALTDQSPDTVRANRIETVESCVALGLDPENSDIFVQSQIEPEVMRLTFQLGRLASLGWLTRVPTLKDKVDDPSKASAALIQYPIMMAADIILQQPELVPTGKDQVAHIEFARDIQGKLNQQLADRGMSSLSLTNGTVTDTPNFSALKGDGKMSKSSPERAILLDELVDVARRKIMKSQTSVSGQASLHMESMTRMVSAIDPEAGEALDLIYREHSIDPESRVAGVFKQHATDVIIPYIERYQARKAQIAASPEIVEKLLKRSGERARKNAQSSLRALGDLMLSSVDI